MIRITKEADYGIMLLGYLASRPRGEVHAAPEIARWSGLNLPIVSKILRTLAQGDILESHRGASGGYSLKRSAEETSVAEVIRAVDGPISMVQCGAQPGACDQEPICPTRSRWAQISDVLEKTLERVPISEMVTVQDCASSSGSIAGDPAVLANLGSAEEAGFDGRTPSPDGTERV